MILKHVSIENQYQHTLRGYFTTSETPKDVAVLMLHGFTGNKTETGGVFKTFSRILAAQNISSLRLDYMGNGESDGEFSSFDWDTLNSDVQVMFSYLTETLNFKKVIILGFSMGGALAIEFAKSTKKELLGLLLWSPAVNIKEIVNRITSSNVYTKNGTIDYLGWEISNKLHPSLENYNYLDTIEKIQVPTLVIHGTKDLAVPFSYGEEVASHITNATIQLMKNATHGYNKIEDKERLFEISLKFIQETCYN